MLPASATATSPPADGHHADAFESAFQQNEYDRLSRGRVQRRSRRGRFIHRAIATHLVRSHRDEFRYRGAEFSHCTAFSRPQSHAVDSSAAGRSSAQAAASGQAQ